MSNVPDRATAPAGVSCGLVWASLILGGFLFLSVCVVVVAYSLGAFKQQQMVAGPTPKGEKPPPPPAQAKIPLHEVIVGRWGTPGGSGYLEFNADRSTLVSVEPNGNTRTGFYQLIGDDEMDITWPGVNPQPITFPDAIYPSVTYHYKVIVNDRARLLLKVNNEEFTWVRK